MKLELSCLATQTIITEFKINHKPTDASFHAMLDLGTGNMVTAPINNLTRSPFQLGSWTPRVITSQYLADPPENNVFSEPRDASPVITTRPRLSLLGGEANNISTPDETRVVLRSVWQKTSIKGGLCPHADKPAIFCPGNFSFIFCGYAHA